MRRRFFMMPRWARIVLMPFVAAAFLAITGFVVMQLWNALLPDILHVAAINFWQALGIFVLCKILFGFGRPGRFGRGNGNAMREHMAERFKNMSAEERERFKNRFGKHGFNRHKWDHFEHEADKATAQNDDTQANTQN